MNLIRTIGALTIVIFVGSVFAHHLDEKTIAERTKRTGKVYREGDKIPAPVVAVVSSAGQNRSAEEVYTQKCALCHDAAIAGAPKFADPAAWSDRIAKGEETLIANAIKGFQGETGVMPPKGGCLDCSDEEVSNAVKYMLEKSQ